MLIEEAWVALASQKGSGGIQPPESQPKTSTAASAAAVDPYMICGSIKLIILCLFNGGVFNNKGPKFPTGPKVCILAGEIFFKCCVKHSLFGIYIVFNFLYHRNIFWAPSWVRFTHLTLTFWLFHPYCANLNSMWVQAKTCRGRRDLSSQTSRRTQEALARVVS